jgi:glucose/arabinose dehydrogenase
MARTAYLLLVLISMAAPCGAQLRGDTIIRGLTNPVAVIPDPTDGTTYLIVEQRGLVRIARDGVLLDRPFLDLRTEVRAGGEQGLLGMALAPDYAESRRVFVNFTNRNGDTVVARFRRHPETPTEADVTSRFDFVWPGGRRTIDQPFDNHNGGHLAFGPDGYLYIGLGDGGSGGDPMNNAQNPQSLLGKMLRLDVNVPDDDERGYRVPDDNPFVDGEPARALPEIWAFGLRNPWRYTFDDGTRGGTGALLIGDVGQNAREEIDFEPMGHGGRNYGWRLREGREPYDSRTDAAFAPLVEPIHDYGRTQGASVTGGVVYRGSALDPGYVGRYFFGDFVSGRLFSIGVHLQPITGEASADDEREHTEAIGRTTLGGISTFAQDRDGELLIANYTAGTVVKIVPDLRVVPAAPQLTASDSPVFMSWIAASDGVTTTGFVIELIQDGHVVGRQSVGPSLTSIELRPGDCARVRSAGPDGYLGPPSDPRCAP